ncbi:hypothetical protein KOR42_00750 [Thalassoglobus neptunius]|uniref:Uncharacterized protein n=1 Tax=Thalassoglobus neptunius TaxID=1938619 RepID=A0A5C5X365_9PLAN|nr:hypothetical protein KOR42_00750 [Thalassoglobus neptunius]
MCRWHGMCNVMEWWKKWTFFLVENLYYLKGRNEWLPLLHANQCPVHQ